MATFKGTESKYLVRVFEAIKKNTELAIGADGKIKVKIYYSPELKKIHKVALTDADKAMIMLKTGSTFNNIFEDQNGSKYKWTQLYKGQFSGAVRKNSTASSNINGVFSLYYLINKSSSFDSKIISIIQSKTGNTGILKGSGHKVTYEELADLILQDSEAEINLKIGFNNAAILLKDIPKTKKILNYYWCPREKPNGVPSSHPSDIVLEFNDKTMMGYSNKAIKGSKDETPKFNTSVTAFYKNNPKTQKKINDIIDDSFTEVIDSLPKNIKNLDLFTKLKKEKYTESGSKLTFKKLGILFKNNKLDFYKEDFYYKYRNTFISKFTNFLSGEKNLVEFLNIIYNYTYTSDSDKLAYKLLVGSPARSYISEVSDNEVLKTILSTKSVQNIKITYDGKSQSFKITGMVNKISFGLTVTNRTRTSGGWSGKSLFMTTPGIKIL